jgi:hypothetical protein
MPAQKIESEPLLIPPKSGRSFRTLEEIESDMLEGLRKQSIKKNSKNRTSLSAAMGQLDK